MQVCSENRQLPENWTFSGRRAPKNLLFLKIENECPFESENDKNGEKATSSIVDERSLLHVICLLSPPIHVGAEIMYTSASEINDIFRPFRVRGNPPSLDITDITLSQLLLRYTAVVVNHTYTRDGIYCKETNEIRTRLLFYCGGLSIKCVLHVYTSSEYEKNKKTKVLGYRC